MNVMPIKFLLALAPIIFIWSCEDSISSSNFGTGLNVTTRTDSIDYLALGDSYTIGQSVDSIEKWPIQLVGLLKNDGFRVRELKVIARTGWTTTKLIEAVEAAELKQYNLVSLLIGVNNQYQSKPFELFETEFEVLINMAIELAGGKENVFVVSIPDYGVTPFGAGNSYSIARELNMYNSYMEVRCADLDIPFIDITSISRRLGDQQGALAPDNLHPSGEQYRQWVEVIHPVVKNLLNN